MGRHKGYDRDEVLERAMGLFWEKGFEGTHLSELVEVTGVNRFGLYGEFGGKEGLFQEALDLYLGRAVDAYRNTLDREPHGLENIRQYFRELSFGTNYHGCFMINTITEQHVVSERAFEAARAVLKMVNDLFLKNLEKARDSGEIGAERDVRTLANCLSTIDNGLSIHGIMAPSDAEKDALVSEALRILH